jgi:hypothetical protein
MCPRCDDGANAINPDAMEEQAMKTSPIITKHAIERYRERVEPGLAQRDVVERLVEVIETATVRSTPRRWMRVASTAPGTRYLYSAQRPDVCLVVAGGAVVTVHSRLACRVWTAHGGTASVQHHQRSLPYRRDRSRPYPEAA